MSKKYLRGLWIICIIIITGSAVFAQEVTNENEIDIDALVDELNIPDSPEEKKEQIEKGEDLRLTFSGEQNFILRVPVIPEHIDFYGNIKAPRFNNELGIGVEHKYISLNTHWQIDAVARESGSTLELLEAQPLENNLLLSLWKLNIGLGYLYYSWGTADGLNPTDNINAFDYRPGSAKEKLPVLSAFVEFFPLDYMSLEAVYLPFVTDSVFPLDYPAMLKEKLAIDAVTDVRPAFEPAAYSLGGKLNFYLPSADFSFSYLYALDPYRTPVIELAPVMAGTDIVFYKIASLELRRNRLHYFGADFKTSLERFGLWAEICYAMTEDYLLNDYRIKNHKLSWITGLDFNFGPDDKFYLNIQQFGDFVPLFDNKLDDDYQDSTFAGQELPYATGQTEEYYLEYYYRSLTDFTGGITEELNLGLLFTVKFPFSIGQLTFEPALTATYSLPLLYDMEEKTRYGNLFVKPRFVISPVPALDITIGADLYYAWQKDNGESTITIAAQDKLGLFHTDSNVYIEVAYQWGFDSFK